MTTKIGAIDGGKTSEFGHHKLLSRLFDRSGVLGWSELRVTAALTPDDTVKITVGDCIIGKNSPSASDYYYSGTVTAQESVTIGTNVSGQARVDSIVAYIDISAVVDTDDDNPGVLKFADVNGTPAGSPVAPDGTAIVAEIGAGNPYVVLADVAVANGFSTITNSNITDQRYLVGTVKRGDWEDMTALTRVSDTTATLVGDWTSEIGTGKPLKWKSNGTLRQNYCIGSSFNSGTGLTTLTITTGYATTANDSRFESGHTITVPQFSKVSSPVGFPYWFNWNPTITAGAGTPTTVTKNANAFSIDGRKVTLISDNTIVDKGTASSTFVVTLPVADGARFVTSAGRECLVSGKTFNIQLVGEGKYTCLDYANATLWVDGYRLPVLISYQI